MRTAAATGAWLEDPRAVCAPLGRRRRYSAGPGGRRLEQDGGASAAAVEPGGSGRRAAYPARRRPGPQVSPEGEDAGGRGRLREAREGAAPYSRIPPPTHTNILQIPSPAWKWRPSRAAAEGPEPGPPPSAGRGARPLGRPSRSRAPRPAPESAQGWGSRASTPLRIGIAVGRAAVRPRSGCRPAARPPALSAPSGRASWRRPAVRGGRRQWALRAEAERGAASRLERAALPAGSALPAALWSRCTLWMCTGWTSVGFDVCIERKLKTVRYRRVVFLSLPGRHWLLQNLNIWPDTFRSTQFILYANTEVKADGNVLSSTVNLTRPSYSFSSCGHRPIFVARNLSL